MKLLKQILSAITPEQIQGPTDKTIDSICIDSRKSAPNALFVAIPGTSADGHLFIDNAIASGATAILCQKFPANLNPEVTYVRVKDSSEALGYICSEFYNHPSKKLKVVGVTGTNGKTTTATLLYQIAKSLGYPAGLFSTVKIMVDNKQLETSHTTPDAIELNRIMDEMVNAGCEYCFMEVSSHSIVQNRIRGLYFTGGIFTNLTQDHLDYHKTMQAYIQSKKLFFDYLPKEAFALTNVDDRNGMVMVQNCRAKISTYGLLQPADFKTRILTQQMEGMLLDIDNQEVWVKLTGDFNAYNLTAIYGACRLLGFEKIEVLKSLSIQNPAQGRFEKIQSKTGIFVIVDYAHTPDAVANVLKTISDIRQGDEKIITVIGAGGDRDKTKRPLMATEACNYSNVVILTSDNPRNEDPLLIIEDMKKGVKPRTNLVTLSNPDRREAIKTALTMAKSGDIVLIAGKGHENYQEIKGVKYPFDDKTEALQLLSELNK